MPKFDDLGQILLIVMFVVVPIVQGIVRAARGKKKRTGDARERRIEPTPSRPPTPEPVADEPEPAGEVVWRELLEGVGVEIDESDEPEEALEPTPEPEPAPVVVVATRPRATSTLLAGEMSAFESIAFQGLEAIGERGAPELATESRGLLGRGLRDATADGEAVGPTLAGAAFAVPRTPADWRRAIVLSEVLGQPIATRRPGPAF